MLVEVTPPLVEPITVDELKAHIRHPPTLGSSEDTYLSDLIVAARQYAEKYCSRPFVPRVFDRYLPEFPSDNSPLRVELGTVLQVLAITYRDPDGATQTFSSSKYRLLSGTYTSHIILASQEVWPSTERVQDAVKVRFVAGFDSSLSPEGADGVPRSIKRAILMLCADMYEVREANIVGTIKQENEVVHRLLHLYRVEAP